MEEDHDGSEQDQVCCRAESQRGEASAVAIEQGKQQGTGRGGNNKGGGARLDGDQDDREDEAEEGEGDGGWEGCAFAFRF